MATEAKTTNPRVSVREHDYLAEDAPLRGQNFACISFVSPEKVVYVRDAFEKHEFLKSMGVDVSGLLTTVRKNFGHLAPVDEVLRRITDKYAFLASPEDTLAQYKAFREKNAASLAAAFSAAHPFQTDVRGIKIRGAYDSVEDARARAKELNQIDPNFNVFVANMGCWCPWNPHPDDLPESEYAEAELNALVRNYNSNARTIHQRHEEARQKRTGDTTIGASDQNSRRDHGAFIEDVNCSIQVNPDSDVTVTSNSTAENASANAYHHPLLPGKEEQSSVSEIMHQLEKQDISGPPPPSPPTRSSPM